MRGVLILGMHCSIFLINFFLVIYPMGTTRIFKRKKGMYLKNLVMESK